MLEKLWRKGDPYELLVGVQMGAATVEVVWKALQKLKMELLCGPAIGYLSEENQNTNLKE